MCTTRNQGLAIFFVSLLASSAVADPIVHGLMQIAAKEVAKNWLSSRARGSLTEELAITARQLGSEVYERTGGVITAIALSPFLLPLWLPLLLIGSAFFMTSLAPAMIPRFVQALSPLLNHIAPVLKNLGFPDIARTLEPQYLARALQPNELLERGFDVLDVKEHECRRKMFCEIGSYALDKQPAFARVLDLFSDMVSKMFPTYAEPLVRGIRGTDCDKLYDKCDASPFGRVLNYYFV